MKVQLCTFLTTKQGEKMLKKISYAFIAFAAFLAQIGSIAVTPALASSHREAPLIANDPMADNTDVYAFRSTEPGREGFVTLIANFIPAQDPGSGPHYYQFDSTVLYEIKIDNTGDGVEDISYQFHFSDQIKNGDTVLGMAAPNEALKGKGGIDPLITSLNDEDYNEYQTYSVLRAEGPKSKNLKQIASVLSTPPANIGKRTTPNYEALAQSAR